MANNKSSLAVAALRNGTVIDHIPTNALFKVVKLLDLETSENQLTIGNNLVGASGKKGIIKVADVFLHQEPRLGHIKEKHQAQTTYKL